MFQTWHIQAANVEDPRDGFKYFPPLSELFWSKFFILLVYLLVFFKKVANLIISPEQLDNLFFPALLLVTFITRVTWMRINVHSFNTLSFYLSCSQFIVDPKSIEKPVKLQLPIMLATYPFRQNDGSLQRKSSGTHYPTTLPVFRPWLEEKSTKIKT